MATGQLAFRMIARHGYAIERLQRDMTLEPDHDHLVQFLAYDAANFVYAFLLASDDQVSVTDRKLRDELRDAILAVLAAHGIDDNTFVWPQFAAEGPQRDS